MAIRRKSKSYIVAQKPEQPLRLGEMPQWKRDLMEKNKQRRVSSDGGEAQSGSVRKMEVSEDGESIPPWRHEVAQRRSTRLSSSTLPEGQGTPFLYISPKISQFITVKPVMRAGTSVGMSKLHFVSTKLYCNIEMNLCRGDTSPVMWGHVMSVPSSQVVV